MSWLRALFASALFGVIQLALVSSVRGDCLGPVPLEIVGTSQPSGPVTFILRCTAGARDPQLACPVPSDVTIRSGFDRAEVAGTFATKPLSGSADRLVLFTPAVPLVPGDLYVLRSRAGDQLSFQPRAASALAPLEQAQVLDGVRMQTAAGALYHECAIGPEPTRVGTGQARGCAAALTLGRELPVLPPKWLMSWSDQAYVYATFDVVVPVSDGWLFRSGSGDWERALAFTVELSSPGVESCVELQAFNTFTERYESRRVCRTGPPATGALQRIPRPYLGECRTAPSWSLGTDDVLFETWCRERAAYCAERAHGPDACEPLDPRCSADAGADSAHDEEEALESDEDERVADGPVTPSAVEGDSGRASGMRRSQAGCVLASSGSRAGRGSLFAFVFALALVGRRMRRHGLRTLAIAAISAISLGVLNPEHARACSALPRRRLEIVANADARGPIVFIARCSGDTCLGLSALRVVLLPAPPAPPTPVSGTFTTKAVPGSTDQLAIFTPVTSLDALGSYMVLEGASEEHVTSFTIAAPGAPAPLDRATTIDGIDRWGVGSKYQCSLSAQDSIGACYPITSFSWNERETGHGIITVSVPWTNGWLVRGAEGMLAESNIDWRLATDVTLRTDPGVENCVSLEAWNVLTDQRETRRVCKTGRTLSAAEQDIVVPTPDLGKCTQVPHVENAGEATWLLQTWCRDRRAYCAKNMGPSACGVLDPRCAGATSAGDASADRADAGLATAEGTFGAKAGADSGADQDADEGNQEGCSLARRSGTRAGSMLWLLLAVALRRHHVRALLRAFSR